MPSKIGKYTCSKTLGRGITAVVKKATDPEGNEFAIKIFENVDEVLLKALRAEVECLINIRVPNIVNCIEFEENGIWEKSDGSKKKIMYIVLELISGGELFDYIATGGPLPEPICRFYFRQMLSAMHSLHSRGTSHRDLKPENILIDDQYNMRIADFGFAAPIEGRDGSGQLRTMLGTESYMAPEIFQKQPYTGQSVDLFASCIVLFIMVTGHPPFGSAVPKDRFYKFIIGNRSDMFWRTHSRNKKEAFSQNFIDLLNAVWQPVPGHRLQFADVVGHPWMKGEIATPEQVQNEFRARHQKILKGQEAEEQQRNAVKENRMAQATAGTFRGQASGVVHIGAEDEEPVQEKMESDPRKLGQFDAKTKRHTQFLTNYEPDLVMHDLHEALQQVDGVMGESIKMHPTKFRCDFKIGQKVIEDFEETESKEEDHHQTILQSACTVKLLQIEGEKLAVEFSRSNGSNTLFLQTYMHLCDKLQNLNNVVA